MAAVKHIPLLLVHLVIYGGFFFWSDRDIGVAPFLLSVPLITASCVDIDRYEIPDSASLFLVLSGLGIQYWIYDDVVWSAIGALLWGIGFALVAMIAKRWLGRDALGLGDVKLIAGIGAWLGPVLPIYVVLCASVAAIATILVTDKGKGKPIFGKAVAFGPFLCLSAWVIWLNGTPL